MIRVVACLSSLLLLLAIGLGFDDPSPALIASRPKVPGTLVSSGCDNVWRVTSSPWRGASTTVSYENARRFTVQSMVSGGAPGLGRTTSRTHGSCSPLETTRRTGRPGTASTVNRPSSSVAPITWAMASGAGGAPTAGMASNEMSARAMGSRLPR